MSSIAAEHPRPLHRYLPSAGACLLALFCVAAIQAFAGRRRPRTLQSQAPHPVTPKLAALAQSDPKRGVDVIVRLAPGASAKAARSFVRTAGGHAGESIGLINAFSARLDAGDAAASSPPAGRLRRLA